MVEPLIISIFKSYPSFESVYMGLFVEYERVTYLDKLYINYRGLFQASRQTLFLAYNQIVNKLGISVTLFSSICRYSVGDKTSLLFNLFKRHKNNFNLFAYLKEGMRREFVMFRSNLHHHNREWIDSSIVKLGRFVVRESQRVLKCLDAENLTVSDIDFNQYFEAYDRAYNDNDEQTNEFHHVIKAVILANVNGYLTVDLTERWRLYESELEYYEDILLLNEVTPDKILDRLSIVDPRDQPLFVQYCIDIIDAKRLDFSMYGGGCDFYYNYDDEIIDGVYYSCEETSEILSIVSNFKYDEVVRDECVKKILNILNKSLKYDRTCCSHQREVIHKLLSQLSE